MAKEEVTSLSWEYDGTTLAFHKDENWIYDEDEAFSVNGEKLEGMLELFEAFVLHIARDPDDLAQVPASDIEVNAYVRVGTSRLFTD